MVFVKICDTISSQILTIASQKLVLRKLLQKNLFIVLNIIFCQQNIKKIKTELHFETKKNMT